MNKRHLETLSSPRWARLLEDNLLPWVNSVADLGDDVLEIGPGPGLTTDLLSRLAAQVTAVEVDADLAAQLAQRLAGGNVTVVHGSAARTSFASDRFTAAASFGVLHHAASAQEQDDIFREAFRVLRPGAALVASDGYDNERTRESHVDDQFIPLDPELLPQRLAAAGFTDVTISPGEYEFRFCARKPDQAR
jgi:SAM-dependent methyltransferase